jgi:hypothetical protein
MDKAQRRRWFVLLSLLAGTIAAIFYPQEEAPLPQPKVARSAPAKAAPMQEIVSVEPSRGWLATDENPFAPRGWIAPAPSSPPALARTVAPVVLPEAAPPPPSPEPLPFRFLGQMSDGDDRIIYLGQGEQVVPARLGDLLDGHYKVVAIQAAQIEFENTTSGLRQTLPLPPQDK